MKELTPDEHKILVDAIQDSATVVHKGRKDMNERIKELKQQAKDFYLLQEDLDCSTKQLHELVEAKFAELIVGECILTIQMGITRDGTKTEKFKRSMTHIKDIKEHFGVEE